MSHVHTSVEGEYNHINSHSCVYETELIYMYSCVHSSKMQQAALPDNADQMVMDVGNWALSSA